MVRTCVVFGCKARADKFSNRSFHAFPYARPNIFQQWIKNVNRKDEKSGKLWQPTKHSRICSAHFLPGDFEIDTLIKKLRESTVPTVFATHPPNLQPKNERKRSQPKERSIDTKRMRPDLSTSTESPSLQIETEHSYFVSRIEEQLKQTKTKLAEKEALLIERNKEIRLLNQKLKRSEPDTREQHHEAWIGLTNEDGSIINGHCTCMTGSSASICSHVAALISKVKTDTFQNDEENIVETDTFQNDEENIVETDTFQNDEENICLTIPHHSKRISVEEVTCADVNPKYPAIAKLLNTDCKGSLPNASMPATSTDNSIEAQHRKGGHSCPKCSLVFPSGASLEIHTKQQHNESALKVVQENAKSPNASSEEKAENGLSGDKLSFRSSQCEENAITSQTRESSPLRYDGDNKCGVFSNSSSLRAHMMKTHCGKMGFKCNRCRKRYCSESELKLHMHSHYNDRSIHGEKALSQMKEGKLFQCNKCGLCYLKSRNLVLHSRNHHDNLLFYCNVCDMAFSSSNLLQAHSLIHKEQKLYVCDECGIIFNQESSLNLHKKVHIKYSMSKEGLYLCHMCGKGFLTTKSLSRHVKIHKRKKSKCQDCGKLFSTLGSLKRHKIIHTGERPHVCDTCGKSFSQKTHLRMHMLSHTGERPFECQTCGKVFRQKGELIIHIRVHTGEKPYECQTCGKNFRRRLNLTQHITTHTGEKLFECQTCGKSFKRKVGLIVHIRTHTGKKPYKCDACGKSFTQKNSLYYHERTHTGKKPYICDVCGKFFSSYQSLSKHMNLHSVEKLLFTCTQCHRSFGSAGSLARHMRIHTGERPYTCEICSMTFRQRSNFVVHLRTHTGERPYKCDICSLGFIEKRCLLRHMEKKHFDKLHVTTVK